MDNKINFLTTAISDAQELIRFIDTKTAIVITILTAYLVAFFASLDNIVKYSFGYSCYFWITIIIFFMLIIFCILITVRIIKPTNNPIKNINFGNSSNNHTLKFFLTPNDYPKGLCHSFANSDEYKLSENFESYSKILNDIEDIDIINSLTLELFKVSFVRNIKNDRFNTLLWLLLITTISFIVFYMFFSIETNNTIEHIEQIRKTCCYS